MGFFSRDDNLGDQLKLHNEVVKNKQQELDNLPEGKSAAMDKYREELTAEIREAKLHMAQVRESAEREGRDVGGYEQSHSMFGE